DTHLFVRRDAVGNWEWWESTGLAGPPATTGRGSNVTTGGGGTTTHRAWRRRSLPEPRSASSRPREAAGLVNGTRGMEYAAANSGRLQVHPPCELEVLFEQRIRRMGKPRQFQWRGG
ncbi:unnamed protein product, partial [Laminaria digitata]